MAWRCLAFILLLVGNTIALVAPDYIYYLVLLENPAEADIGISLFPNLTNFETVWEFSSSLYDYERQFNSTGLKIFRMINTTCTGINGWIIEYIFISSINSSYRDCVPDNLFYNVRFDNNWITDHVSLGQFTDVDIVQVWPNVDYYRKKQTFACFNFIWFLIDIEIIIVISIAK